MSKSSDKRESVQAEAKAPEVKYRYVCPACTNTAVESSNQMLGIEIDCKSCGKHIALSSLGNYIKL